MALLRSQFRRIIALTSMAALLLGVFEHESLLFQRAVAAAELPSVPEASRSLEGFGLVDRDGGPEGTFRSEGKFLCSVPTMAPRLIWRLPAPRTVSESAALPLHLRAHSRARISGVRALRL